MTARKTEKGPSTTERLLDAATHLLEREGLPGFNTNALAKTAGLTPPTVYRHFRDKYEVLRALAERLLQAELNWLTDLAQLEDPETPWRPVLSRALAVYLERSSAFPGIHELRAALRGHPQLAESERRSLEEPSLVLARALERRRGGLAPPDHATRLAASLVVETACYAMDRIRLAPPAERELRLSELEQMLAGYLADRLD